MCTCVCDRMYVCIRAEVRGQRAGACSYLVAEAALSVSAALLRGKCRLADSPVSTSHLHIGVLPLQMCTTASDFHMGRGD